MSSVNTLVLDYFTIYVAELCWLLEPSRVMWKIITSHLHGALKEKARNPRRKQQSILEGTGIIAAGRLNQLHTLLHHVLHEWHSVLCNASIDIQYLAGVHSHGLQQFLLFLLRRLTAEGAIQPHCRVGPSHKRFHARMF